jgi:hypothetical protein
MGRRLWTLLLWCSMGTLQAQAADCGTVVELTANGATPITRYSWKPGSPTPGDAAAEPVAAILLIGGGGWLDLDATGCPRRLKGNILVRSAPRWQAAGVTTVLVDARTDWTGDDGLAGFRLHSEHAQDLGRLIADVRARTGAKAVWLLGHSRGTLSAANAAGRLTGADAPDGVVLAAPMLEGDASSKRKPWVAQTVFETGVKTFRGSLLLVGHAADSCVRSLPERLDALALGAAAARQQVVRVTGGPFSVGRAPSLPACEVREPHDFVDQDDVFADGVLRFMRGGKF